MPAFHLTVFDISHHTHNAAGVVALAANSDQLPERIFTREIHSCEFFVDNERALARGPVPIVKKPSCAQRNFHSFEISWQNSVCFRLRLIRELMSRLEKHIQR